MPPTSVPGIERWLAAAPVASGHPAYLFPLFSFQNIDTHTYTLIYIYICIYEKLVPLHPCVLMFPTAASQGPGLKLAG
jgi:hypothetical protein